MSQNSSELQLVPETVLKRKHDMDEMRAHRAAQEILNPRGNRKVFSQKTKVVKIRKAENLLARARSRKNHAIRYKRVLRKGMQKRASKAKESKTKVFIPDGVDETEEEKMRKEVNIAVNSVGSNMVFVIRIRDNVGMPKDVKKVLCRFRLRNANEGVFLRYDSTMKKLLHLVEPWVTYGIPSKAMISDLLHRRGHGKVDGQRIPLSDNTLIEKALGDETEGGIICVQDLEHELYSVGEHFTKANAFLWPFCLTAPKSKFQKRKLNFKDGGDYGDRGQEIDDLIRLML